MVTIRRSDVQHYWNHFRLKLEPSARCVATFYCDGFKADGTALALGTLDMVPFSNNLAKEGA
ncbi:hypothetical protein DD238_006529 [Peronospora effusa]|uniref:Uncharacterized protein n=1 Tax=Peronospora effusa TaxID=542832 RepID=A0A3M6VJ80_9STRA|nr:hypothetical protein DD238_006529 [Peronospora effusa]RQM10006.1 hypothetical protein DD237_006876 [Peronospora effusa]